MGASSNHAPILSVIARKNDEAISVERATEIATARGVPRNDKFLIKNLSLLF